MVRIEIREVSNENLDDLCQLCVPVERRSSPIYGRGMEDKKKWATHVLERSGVIGKLAYYRSKPAGLLQYELVEEEKLIRIQCIYVPDSEHWRKGVATRLFSTLLDEAKESRRWFGVGPLDGIVVRTFPAEQHGQYPARLFFKRSGFVQVGNDPDQLFFPLRRGASYKPLQRIPSEYLPQEEDRNRATILYNPSFCPFSYVLLRKGEDLIREVIPEIQVHWIDKSEQPGEFEKRGGFEGCVVNLNPIKSFVLNEEQFKKEVKLAVR